MKEWSESYSQDVDDPILKVRDATVTFDMERGESKVLHNANLDIQREEILGVVGESGSGKSMFASALLDAVTDPGQLSGEITFYPQPDQSIDLLDLTPKELKSIRWDEIAMVFQGAMDAFNPTQRIRRHFVETLNAHNCDIDEGMTHAREVLSDLHLNPDRVLSSYPHELSGGMKQRVLIALSLVLKPQVLVLDEPTAALDLLMQRSILDLLRKIQKQYEITLVFITHDLPLVAEISDRLAVMYAFEFAEIGPTEELLRNAAHPYTRSLLNATPNLDADIDSMRPIEGSSPDPVNVPQGCSYHPRCPLASQKCISEHPTFQDVSDDHQAACFHWEESSNQIPVDFGNRQITAPKASSSVVEDESAGSQTGDPLLSLNDVKVHFNTNTSLLNIFGKSETIQAVDGISVDIFEDDVIVLVGESGCGKTTLGKTAIGIQRPTEGNVEYRGQDIWDAKYAKGNVNISYSEIRRSLQIIHQDPGSSLDPTKKVTKILSEPLKLWQSDLTTEDRRARIYGMLEHVGMSPPNDYANRYPHQLSGGEQQRVALSRALLMNPDMILADEAISALDVSLRIEMMDLLLDLQEQFGTSFLAISHDLSNARYLAEKGGGKIGIMYLGELVEFGPVDQIIQNPQHPYTQILKEATPNLEQDEGSERLRTRDIDIPDPSNPPSGCRFHTRCPKARKVCRHTEPESVSVTDEHKASCFRAYENHEYWADQPLHSTNNSRTKSQAESND